MRIRRRPPGQPLPYSSSVTNDSAADLGDGRSSSSSALIRRPTLWPQDGAVERSTGLVGAQQQQQQGPADGHSSLEKGLHRHVPEPVMMAQVGERVSSGNGVGAAVAVATTTTSTAGAKATKHRQTETNKDTGGGGGVKRAPRGPGVLMEGSRCSRKNGRGWRCSQPTLVGYALCQYHLVKGRTKSGSAAAGGGRGRGPGQLGRTERANKTSAAADVPPAQSVQHC